MIHISKDAVTQSAAVWEIKSDIIQYGDAFELVVLSGYYLRVVIWLDSSVIDSGRHILGDIFQRLWMQLWKTEKDMR